MNNMKKTLKIKSGNINAYKDTDKLDITVMSAKGVGKYFAPTWEMVKGFKNGKLSWAEYESMYLEKLRQLWISNRWVFRELFNLDSVTFVCYCKNDIQCHRRLLREIIVKIGKRYSINIIDYGEIKIK